MMSASRASIASIKAAPLPSIYTRSVSRTLPECPASDWNRRDDHGVPDVTQAFDLTRTTSPTFRNTGGLCAMPTPAHVPVARAGPAVVTAPLEFVPCLFYNYKRLRQYATAAITLTMLPLCCQGCSATVAIRANLEVTRGDCGQAGRTQRETTADFFGAARGPTGKAG